MPDVQVSPNAGTRDYLNITETADRSRRRWVSRRWRYISKGPSFWRSVIELASPWKYSRDAILPAKLDDS